MRQTNSAALDHGNEAPRAGEPRPHPLTQTTSLAHGLLAPGSYPPVPALPVQHPGDGAVEGQIEQREKQ